LAAMDLRELSVIGMFGVLGGFNFGYNTGIISMARDLLLVDLEINKDSPLYQGLCTGAVLVGAMIGSMLGGIMANKWGRKLSNVVGSALSVFGVVCSVLAPDIWTWLVFRVVLGGGIGITAVVCPMYVSERSPPEKRGMMGVLFQLTLTFGIFLSSLLGYAITVTALPTTWKWRLMLSLGVLFPGFLLILSLLRMVEPHSVDETPIDTVKPRFGEVCSSPPLRKLMVMDTMLAVILQLTGINVVMYYGPDVVRQAIGNNDTQLAFLVNIGVLGWNFVSTIFAIVLVDRLGRRPLMLGGTGILSVALIIIGVASQLPDDKISTTARGAVVGIGLFGFIFGFEVGPGCLFWVIVNELFPPEHIETGSTYANALQWAFNLLVSGLFPTLVASPLHIYGTFYLFGAIGVVSTVYAFFALPETRSKERDSL